MRRPAFGFVLVGCASVLLGAVSADDTVSAEGTVQDGTARPAAAIEQRAVIDGIAVELRITPAEAAEAANPT